MIYFNDYIPSGKFIKDKAEVFNITFLDKTGRRQIFTSEQFDLVEILDDRYVFQNPDVFDGKVSILKSEENGTLFFKVSVDNNTEYIIESVKFPILRIPCKLTGDGGNDLIFWPSLEGTLVDRANDNKYYTNAVERLGGGYTGLAPAGTSMQFMAIYSDKGGLYFGTHDKDCNFKDFEYCFEDNGIVRFECTHFVGGCKNYSMTYPVVLREFEGDWQDAAEIYRKWLYSSGMSLPEKLAIRKDLPQWLYDSPVLMIYPVRGTTDKDCDSEMKENCYYPYSNILPVVDKFSKSFGSRIMALMMHWEGSAPWSNPYVWPPHGDVADFEKTVKELHRNNNLVGLYASGIGITTKSVKDSSYDITDRYLGENWSEATCRDSKGNEIRVSDLSFVRDGFEVCPYCEKTVDVTIDEAVKIAKADVDYFQAFDQNIGGMSHFCWSKDHGHPPAPGRWITDSMIKMLEKIRTSIESAGKSMLIGCELAACEPLMKYLTCNDLRWFITIRQGRPVPAYNYIYHEYVCNFMGNQNELEKTTNFCAAPDNLLYRTVYSFLAGDILSVTLGDDGNISWGWNAPFYDNFPESKYLTSFIKSANNWRRSFAKKYLMFGKMLKTLPANCKESTAFVTSKGYKLKDRVILNRRFAADDNTVAEFFVNRTFSKQELHLNSTCGILYKNPETPEKVTETVILKPGEICCVIDKLSTQSEN
ncbi:MAG: hypothetical protein IJT84_05495 [Clostridia bacterium]|nr:hypothetical protein [Clostridia bacterium]